MLTGSLESVFASCAALASTVRVTGLAGSARAWAILRYLRHFRKSLLVIICPDEETCLELESDLVALKSLPLSEAPSEVGPEVAVFPSFERSLYSSISPSLRTRLTRAGVLSRLAQADFHGAGAPLILLTTLDAASLRTPPPELFKSLCVSLKRGESCGSRESLVSSLIQAGYLRADTAEDPGTFSARGEIIDIYAADPTLAHPCIRIELFDDVIDRIRPYHPETQRSLEIEINSAFIGPCREFLINPSTLPGLRERIKSFADEQGIPRTVR
ncbi:MAG: hypothetical protein KGQ59_09695, partial [Bdellovibrionales bacterium]|nr:hypothetical protein [Bdellovibrionales bacterium]